LRVGKQSRLDAGRHHGVVDFRPDRCGWRRRGGRILRFITAGDDERNRNGKRGIEYMQCGVGFHWISFQAESG
jgi:hypothetical protein